MIITAFIIVLMEIERQLTNFLAKINNWILPQEKKCLSCNCDIEDFDMEFPFCEECAPEIEEQIHTIKKPKTDDINLAYQ